MNRKKAIELCGIFFALMLAFTLLARGADSLTVAQVQVKLPGKQRISRQVSGSGKVGGSEESAVFMESGQKIARAHVRAGSRVEAGDLLYTVDLAELKFQLEALRREEETQKLLNQDAAGQAQVQEQKRGVSQRRAKEDYERAAREGDAAVAAAQEEVNLAYDRLWEYLQGSGGFQNEAEAAEDGGVLFGLQDALRAKEQALEAAIREREASLAQAVRGIEDAEMEEAPDSAQAVGKLALEDKTAKKERLEALYAQGGEVRSPMDGVVTKQNLCAGDVSTDGAALLLAELDAQLTFTAPVSAEEETDVSVGSPIALKGDKDLEQREDLVVESVRTVTDENGAEGKELTVLLPPGSGKLGQSLEFTVTREGPVYDCCVPISALRQENGNYFLYVMEESRSILGEEHRARKAPVVLEDQNEFYAALRPGAVSTQEKVIVHGDREIEDGGRVRLEEN